MPAAPSPGHRARAAATVMMWPVAANFRCSRSWRGRRTSRSRRCRTGSTSGSPPSGAPWRRLDDGPDPAAEGAAGSRVRGAPLGEVQDPAPEGLGGCQLERVGVPVLEPARPEPTAIGWTSRRSSSSRPAPSSQRTVVALLAIMVSSAGPSRRRRPARGPIRTPWTRSKAASWAPPPPATRPPRSARQPSSGQPSPWCRGERADRRGDGNDRAAHLGHPEHAPMASGHAHYDVVVVGACHIRP